MIVDTSALVVILFLGPEADQFLQLINEASSVRMSAANFVETSLVIESHRNSAISRQIGLFIRRADISIEPVTIEHAYIARQAFLDFGKGRHPASLNFGDCFAYALAKATGESLLFKGNDFTKTDLSLAR